MTYQTKYYRLASRALRRNSETTATEVLLPAQPKDRLPLSMSEVTYPTRERMDEEVAKMEEVDQPCFEDYVLGFVGRVESNIARPMTELNIQRQLARNQNVGRA